MVELNAFKLVENKLRHAVPVSKPMIEKKGAVKGLVSINNKEYKIYNIDTKKIDYASKKVDKITTYTYRRYGFIIPSILEPDWMKAKVKFYTSGNYLLLEKIT